MFLSFPIVNYVVNMKIWMTHGNIRACMWQPSKRFTQCLLILFNDRGSCINVSGAFHTFDNKGIVDACVIEGSSPIKLEKAEEIAIELGAEEVTVSEDAADDKLVYQVHV